MAERRMIAKSIIKSDQFLDMPATTQCLYFHLLLEADDDGFINAPKSIMRVIGAKDDDMRVLQAKGYIIPFESGVIVIKHWRLHNSLRKDRYNPNPQLENERKQLVVADNKEYQLATNWQPNGNQLATSGIPLVATGKDRLGKDRLGKSNQLANADSFAQSQKYLNNINQDINKVTLFYEQNIGLLSPFILEEIEEYQSQISDDMIIEAIKRAVEAGKRNWKYTKGIINNWISQGIKTLAEVQQNDKAFKKAKETKQSKIIIETPEQEKARLLKEQEEYLKRKAERERKEAEKKAKEEAEMFQIHEDRKEKKVVNKEAINEVMNIFKNSTNK